MLIAIETCFGNCSVALYNNETFLGYYETEKKSMQAEKLFVLIKQALDENNLKIDDISHLALTVGPGSFTGVRIGIAAALALNIAKNIKVLCLSSLQVFAYKNKSDEDFTITIDASRNEFYTQVFSTDLEELSEITLSKDVPNCNNKDINAKDVGELTILKMNDASFFKELRPIYVRSPDAMLPKL